MDPLSVTLLTLRTIYQWSWLLKARNGRGLPTSKVYLLPHSWGSADSTIYYYNWLAGLGPWWFEHQVSSLGRLGSVFVTGFSWGFSGSRHKGTFVDYVTTSGHREAACVDHFTWRHFPPTECVCVCVCVTFALLPPHAGVGCTIYYQWMHKFWRFDSSISAAKYETVESLILKEFNCTDVALLFFKGK